MVESMLGDLFFVVALFFIFVFIFLGMLIFFFFRVCFLVGGVLEATYVVGPRILLSSLHPRGALFRKLPSSSHMAPRVSELTGWCSRCLIAWFNVGVESMEQMRNVWQY